MIVILFGVTGSGKTAVGSLLARELGWRFYDADDFHSTSNVEKMRRGIPLTDADRWPWLARLRQQIARCLNAGQNAVLACSALKRAYRRHLGVNAEVRLVYLEADYATIADRLRERRDHFMNPELLRSQFDALEPPSETEAETVDVRGAPGEIVRTIRQRLAL